MARQRTARLDDSLLRLLGIADGLNQDVHGAPKEPNRRVPRTNAAASVAASPPTDISHNKHVYLALALTAEARAVW